MSIPYDYFGKIIQVDDVIMFVEQKRRSQYTSFGMLGRAVVKRISDTVIYIESLPTEAVREEIQTNYKSDMFVDYDLAEPTSTARKRIHIDKTTMVIIGKIQDRQFRKG